MNTKLRMIFKISFSILFVCLIMNCPVISSEIITTGEWDYRVRDGYAEIVGYNGMEKELVIPATIDDIPVKTIGEFALAGHLFTSVEISNGIERIEDWAFWACSDLESIKIPESLKLIPYNPHFGYTCFDSCSSLENIYVDVNHPKYSSQDGVLYSKSKSSLYIYPSGKKDRSFILPYGVTHISGDAFTDCINLKEIYLSETVQYFSNIKLLKCENLKDIKVAKNNKYFSDIDGVLYNKYKTELIYCAPAKNLVSYKIHSGVKNIGDYAFYLHKKLNNIYIPNGVEKIGDYSFYQCESLDNVVLPNSIISIGEGSFGYCSNLFDITLSESLVNIGEEAFYACDNLRSITIPKSVKLIGTSAFYCFGLRKAIFLGDKPENMENPIFVQPNKNFVIMFDMAYLNSWKYYDIYPTEVFEKMIEVTTTNTNLNNDTINIKPKKVQIKYAKKKSVDKIKISIKKVKDVTGYQLAVYKTNKNAKSNNKGLVCKNKKKHIFTVKSKKFIKCKNLYVKVRAYIVSNGKKKYGKWSNVKKIKMIVNKK